ncbi:MAG: transposase [Nodosilinea sp.]
MANHSHCPHCQSQQLLRIGVRGIRQCAHCKAYVDVRAKNWLRQIISGLAA